MALAFTVGSCTLLPVTEVVLGHATAATLAGKVTLLLNHKFDAQFPAKNLSRATIALEDRRKPLDIIEPKGEASNPLNWKELEDKFNMAVRFVVTKEARQELALALRSLRDGQTISRNALRKTLVLLS